MLNKVIIDLNSVNTPFNKVGTREEKAPFEALLGLAFCQGIYPG